MRVHQMWDDFVTFVTGGNPHGPPARPDTNKIVAAIDAAPVRETQVDPTHGTDGAVTIQQSQLTPAITSDASAQSFAARVQNRVFVRSNALQILRMQAEETQLRMSGYDAAGVPPGFKSSGLTEY